MRFKTIWEVFLFSFLPYLVLCYMFLNQSVSSQRVPKDPPINNARTMDVKNDIPMPFRPAGNLNDIPPPQRPSQPGPNLAQVGLDIPTSQRQGRSKMQDISSLSATDIKPPNSGSGGDFMMTVPNIGQSLNPNGDIAIIDNGNGNRNNNGNGNRNNNGNGNRNNNGNGNRNNNGNGNRNNNGNGIGNRNLIGDGNTNANSDGSGNIVRNGSENPGPPQPNLTENVNGILRSTSNIPSESEIKPEGSRTLTQNIQTETFPESSISVNAKDQISQTENPIGARTQSISTEITQTAVTPTPIFTQRITSTITPVRTRVPTQPTITFAPNIPPISSSFPNVLAPAVPDFSSPFINGNVQASRNNLLSDTFPSALNNPADVTPASVTVEPPPINNPKLFAASVPLVSSAPQRDPSTTITNGNGISILPPTTDAEAALYSNEVNADNPSSAPSSTIIIAASAAASSIIVLCGLSGFYIFYKNKKKRSETDVDSIRDISPVSLAQEVLTVFIPYNPELSDELYLSVGDKVIVQERFQDNWAIGSNVTTGNFGCFPLVCLDSDAASSIASEIGSIRSSYSESKSQRTYSLHYSEKTVTTASDEENLPY